MSADHFHDVDAFRTVIHEDKSSDVYSHYSHLVDQMSKNQ